MQKISEIAGELANTKKRITRIEDRVTGVENLYTELELLKRNANDMRSEIEKYEESAVSTDVVIVGIPPARDENISEIFAKLCRAINTETPGTR